MYKALRTLVEAANWKHTRAELENMRREGGDDMKVRDLAALLVPYCEHVDYWRRWIAQCRQPQLARESYRQRRYSFKQTK